MLVERESGVKRVRGAGREDEKRGQGEVGS